MQGQDTNQKSITQRIQEYLRPKIKAFQENFLNGIANHLDLGYRYARSKQPQTEEDLLFIQKFQDIFLLQTLSFSLLFITMASTFRIYQLQKAHKTLPRILPIICLTTGAFSAVISIKALNIQNKYQVIKQSDKYSIEFQQIMKAITPQNTLEEKL